MLYIPLEKLWNIYLFITNFTGNQFYEPLTYQGSKKMVKYEVNGNHWSPHMAYCHKSLVHDIYPALLCQDLEHGHEGLEGDNQIWTVGLKNSQTSQLHQLLCYPWIADTLQSNGGIVTHLKELRAHCTIVYSDSGSENLILVPNSSQGTSGFLQSSRDMLSQAMTDQQPPYARGCCR